MQINEKAALRREYKEERLLVKDKGKKSLQICEALLSSEIYKEAGQILCFYPIKEEPDIRQIAEHALTDGKRVALPVCRGEERGMNFYYIKSMQALKEGKFGIPEPDTEYSEEVRDFSNALALLPGIAFDKAGYRLGYGGGYYDKFFGKAEWHGLAGICYGEMLKSSLPHDEHDIRVNYICTEAGLKKVNT